MCLLAVVFAGHGIRALQEAGVSSIHALGIPRIDMLGVYPTWETAAIQLVMLALLGGSAAWTFRPRPESPRSQSNPSPAK